MVCCSLQFSISNTFTDRKTECIRKIVMDRLEQRGMKRLALPLGAAPEEPHLDILVSDNLDTCKRLLILTPDSYGSNLGIWGMRQIQQGSINVKHTTILFLFLSTDDSE
jgi:hypothetical protein